MADRPTDLPAKGPHETGERLVYVIPEQSSDWGRDDEINLRELWGVLWARKWGVIAVTAAFAAAAVAYALLATEWFRAEVLLAPAEEKTTPSLGTQLGGLAALAGVSMSGGNSAEAVAILKGREFAAGFIQDNDLVKVFFAADWDSEADRWRMNDVADWPDIWDAVKYFHKEVLEVTQDSKTGLVRLAIEWTDPEVAAEWASSLADRLNEKLRARALREAETNVGYLQDELARTSLISLQQTISRLLESELQKLMLARGSEEYAFRVIDAAAAPKEQVHPRRALIVVIGALLGGFLGVLWALAAYALRPTSV